jgi:hypothetical protein
MVETLYKYQGQRGETRPPYEQKFPSWGWFAMQIQTDVSTPVLGWFDCDGVCLTEWLMTSFGGGRYTVKIDLNNQDAYYNKTLYAMIYQNTQTTSNPQEPIILGVSEPFNIQENWQNIHEFEYSNNEMIDGVSYAGWKGYGYSQFTFDENEYPVEETVYIDSNNTKIRLSASLQDVETISTASVPKYELERLNFISIHDYCNIDGVAYICENFVPTFVKLYSLMQCKSKVSKTIFNYQNSNC